MAPVPLHHILFLDIETTAQYGRFEELPVAFQDLWTRKAASLIRDKANDSASSLYPHAALFAEFGKVICISCGIISQKGNQRTLSIKSFHGDNEIVLLREFSDTLSKWGNSADKWLCAHNGKEFDFPFLCRRLVINQLPIPAILDFAGKKKWDLPHLDTLEMWKFGEYKNFSSLNLLALVLGIATPKDDIDGAQVNQVYWRDHDLDRIVQYCQKDVITVAQVYLRLKGESPLAQEDIEIK